MTIVQGRRCNALIHASTARSAGDHGRGRGMGRGGTVQAARQNLVGRKNERSEQRRYAIQSDTVSISQSVSVRRSFSEPPTQEASHVLKMTSQTYPPGPEDRRSGPDQNSRSVPRPRCRALATASSAAARSSTARPSDLNRVSSPSEI